MKIILGWSLLCASLMACGDDGDPNLSSGQNAATASEEDAAVRDASAELCPAGQHYLCLPLQQSKTADCKCVTGSIL